MRSVSKTLTARWRDDEIRRPVDPVAECRLLAPLPPMIKRENLHTIYILLFLNIAFFFLELQNAEHYQALFAFDRDRVMAGEVWRIFTYQFVQGSFFFSPALALFFTLLILYIMGSAVEQEWGSFDFILFLLISTLGSAAVGFLLNQPLLGSYAISFSLLFVFATLYPDQTFYIFFVLPVKVRWIAYAVLAILLLRIFARDAGSMAALGGAAFSYAYYLARFRRGYRLPRLPGLAKPAFQKPPAAAQHAGEGNLKRFAVMKDTLASGSEDNVRSLIQEIEPEIIEGVNICPPADYKPENEDRYCVRCEGFAECSVRFLRLSASEVGRSDQPSAGGV